MDSASLGERRTLYLLTQCEPVLLSGRCTRHVRRNWSAYVSRTQTSFCTLKSCVRLYGAVWGLPGRGVSRGRAGAAQAFCPRSRARRCQDPRCCAETTYQTSVDGLYRSRLGCGVEQFNGGANVGVHVICCSPNSDVKGAMPSRFCGLDDMSKGPASRVPASCFDSCSRSAVDIGRVAFFLGRFHYQRLSCTQKPEVRPRSTERCDSIDRALLRATQMDVLREHRLKLVWYPSCLCGHNRGSDLQTCATDDSYCRATDMHKPECMDAKDQPSIFCESRMSPRRNNVTRALPNH